jgi:hypothetical protein
MTIQIRTAPYERVGGDHLGPFEVHPDLVQMHLGVIAMSGTEDLPGSMNTDTDPADPEYLLLEWDPGPQDTTTASGQVRQLLKDMVDSSRDFKLFGVGPGFVWSDGSTLRDGAGGALGSFLFYDVENCEGDGRWVRGVNGEEVCTSSAGILFHEMGHRHLGHPSGFSSEDTDNDERAAVGVENLLRTAQGLVERDPDHWPESSCGCPGSDCCIVASVASGSPYSSEVHALRFLRDYILRTTVLGRHLFDMLHSEYYSFSVSVCRIMLLSPEAKTNVQNWLVIPLIQSYEAARRYACFPEDIAGLGKQVMENSLPDSPVESLEHADLEKGLLFIEALLGRSPSTVQNCALDASTIEICDTLKTHLHNCPHITWAIVEPLLAYVETKVQFRGTAQVEDAGLFFKQRMETWLPAIPLRYLLPKMSDTDLLESLSRLSESVFTSPDVRKQLGIRISDILSSHKRDAVTGRLRDMGYL